MSTLTELRDRVANAAGPDLELDMAILSAFSLPPSRLGHRMRFTASLDAVLALAEKVTPGWYWYVNSSNRALTRDTKLGGISGYAEATTPALALLFAVLNALVARAGEPG